MAALNVNLPDVLFKINDEAFRRVKIRIQTKRNDFINPKDHPMAAPLLGVLCSDDILPILNRNQMTQIIQAMIPNDILELKWLCRYCDLLVKALGNVQQNTKKDERASKYTDYLINTLIPEFKKTTQSSTKTSNFAEPLSFIFKIASCLLRCSAHNKYPFDLTVDRSTMEELAKRINKLPVNIFESYRNEERAYGLFISWILEEIICEQDGVEEEE